MKRFCFFLILFCFLLDVNAQKCTLVFQAPQGEITVRVYKPVDETYNWSYISDKLDIKPGISISYEVEVNDFEFVMCRFSTGHRRYFLVEPGDRIEINCVPLTISGSNAEGHNYFNDNWVHKGLGYYHVEKMEPIFKRYVTNTSINYDSINYYFQKELILPYHVDLKKMEMSGSITPKFSSMLAKNLYYACCSLLQNCYNFLLRGWINDYKPSREEAWNSIIELSKIYETPYALSDESKKMPFNSITEYYWMKYQIADEETKENFTKGYDKDFYGSRPWFLMASDSIQLSAWSNLFIQNLHEGTQYFNHEKVLAYLDEKFPGSEYVTIIKKMMAQSQSSEENNEIVIINDSIASLQELMQIPGIKGKYAYIDLWETVCVPCVFEFQFNDDVHKLLVEYNIVPIYISIDTNRKLWESRVMKYGLKGYNIMASKSLQEDIGMKIYKADKVKAIPRYLLLNPEGNTVNDNLPRPSKSEQLKLIFANELK